MILIRKNFQVQESEITLDIYLERNFSVSLINKDQKILFRADTASSYIVDESTRRLLPFDAKNAQMDQLKALLGEIWLEKTAQASTPFKHQVYIISNNIISSPAQLTGEVAVFKDGRLRNTVNAAQNLHENSTVLFDLALKDDELFSYIKTKIVLNGQQHTSSMKVEALESVKMPLAYHEFMNYPILEKVA